MSVFLSVRAYSVCFWLIFDNELKMRDLVQFVRQLWEDRLQSVEDFTKENNLSLEEALQVRFDKPSPTQLL